jgi:hypothetical protein
VPIQTQDAPSGKISADPQLAAADSAPAQSKATPFRVAFFFGFSLGLSQEEPQREKRLAQRL